MSQTSDLEHAERLRQLAAELTEAMRSAQAAGLSVKVNAEPGVLVVEGDGPPLQTGGRVTVSVSRPL